MGRITVETEYEYPSVPVPNSYSTERPRFSASVWLPLRAKWEVRLSLVSEREIGFLGQEADPMVWEMWVLPATPQGCRSVSPSPRVEAYSPHSPRALPTLPLLPAVSVPRPWMLGSLKEQGSQVKQCWGKT